MAQQVRPLAQQKAHSRLTLSQRNSILGYALVAPVVLCLLALVFYPFLFAIWISFTDQVVGGQG